MSSGSSGQGKRFGSYVIHGEIARGGQGAVLEATHEPTGRRVALKLLLDRTPRSQKRFRQEAEILSRLRHPNLLRVTDHGDWQGMAYMAMEHVEGEDLSRVLKTRGIPDPAWSAKVLAEVADALEHCHQSGVVHRDVKPANVLIERGTDRTVLVDFGMVKRDPERLGITILDDGTRFSKTGELKGTPAFMAPEQVNSAKFGEVGPRTDVHALGATLFLLLTGEQPFEGDTLPSLMVGVLSTDPPDPRKLNPSVPPALAELCLQCLAKSPDARPPTAAAVAAALRSGARPERRAAAGGRGPIALSLALNVLLVLALVWALQRAEPPSRDLSWEEALRVSSGTGTLTDAELQALAREADAAGDEWARWLPYLRVQSSLRTAPGESSSLAQALPEGSERDLLAAEAAAAGGDLEAAFESLDRGASATLPWRTDEPRERWLALADAAIARDARGLAARALLRAAGAEAPPEARLRWIERAFALDALTASRAGQPVSDRLLASARETLAGPADVSRAQAYASARSRLFLWRLIRPDGALPAEVLADLRRLGDVRDSRIYRAALPGIAPWRAQSPELYSLLSEPLAPGGIMAGAGQTKIPQLPAPWNKWIQRAHNQDERVTRAMLEECLLWRPESAVLWAQLASLDERGGLFGRAVRARQVALDLETADPGWAHYHLGTALLNAGLFEQSVSASRRAIEVEGSPQTSTAQWAGLCLAQGHLRLGRPAEALAALDDLQGSWMAGRPNYFVLRSNALTQLNRPGEADEADAIYRRVLPPQDR